jgi:hypothetical protein
MGAETRILVEVEIGRTTCVEVYAVTLEEAREKAHSLPGVLDVLCACYPDDSNPDEAPVATSK